MTAMQLDFWNLALVHNALASKPSQSAKVAHCPLIVIVAPKGGVGKTTLTMALLVSAGRSGQRSYGISMDHQKSLDKWAIRRRRQKETPEGSEIIDVPVENMNVHDYRRLSSVVDRDVIIIDTPPGHGDAQNSIIALCAMADLILIPTSSSPMDLDEVIPFRRELSADKAWFVLNGVNRRARSYHRSKGVLMKAGRLCPVDIPFLEAIPNQFMRGLASTDQGEGGAEWFDALWDFVRHEVNLPAHASKDGSR